MSERVVVESLAPGGEGVIRLADGRVAFVSGVIEGERVRVELGRAGGKKLQARLLEVLEASPDRVTPPCAHAGACGGCDWMHLDRGAQGARHASIVRALLERALGAAPVVEVHQLDEREWRRTRARLAVRVDHGRARLGFRARGTHDVEAISSCLVLEPGLFEAATECASWLATDRERRSGELAVAFGVRGGERLPVVDLSLDRDPPPAFFARADEATRGGGPFGGLRLSLAGATKPAVLGDPRPIQRGFDGAPLVCAAAGFAQANDAGGAVLATRAAALARPEGAKVLELFAGSGTLSVALARGAKSFASIEASADAVGCARENLTARGLTGTLRAADAEAVELPRDLDVVVLDPPRAGAPGAMKTLSRARPRRVVYVSCDAATLARDLSALAGAGYVLTALETVELFSHTSHVEILALCERRRGGAA